MNSPPADRRGHFKLCFKKRHSALAWIVFPSLAGTWPLLLWLEPNWRGFWEVAAALLLTVVFMRPFLKKGHILVRENFFTFDHYPDLVIEIPFAAVEVMVETPSDLTLLFKYSKGLKTVRLERLDFASEHWDWIVTLLGGRVRDQAPSATISLAQP